MDISYDVLIVKYDGIYPPPQNYLKIQNINNGSGALAQVLKLSDELQSLGGGDAVVNRVEVHCRVAPHVGHAGSQLDINSAPHVPSPLLSSYFDNKAIKLLTIINEPSLTGIISTHSDHVMVRDPRASEDVPADRAFRRWPVTKALGPTASQTTLFAALGPDLVTTLLDGFNASVIAFGQTGTGKTYSLLGPGGLSPAESEGLVSRVLSELFVTIDRQRDQATSDADPLPTRARNLAPALQEAMLAGSREGRFRVGLSVWEVLGAEAVDLMMVGAPPSAAAGKATKAAVSRPAEGVVKLLHVPGGSMDVVTCHIADLAEGLSVLHQCLRRSSNWGGDGSFRPVPLPNRSHLFVRVMLHDEGRARVSTLHFADLAGSQSLNGQAAVSQGGDPREPSVDVSVQREAERRGTNLSLLAASKLIAEVAQRSHEIAAEGHATSPLLSVNESLLTQHLAPLLAGNCKTTVLCTISGKGADFLDTNNSLRIVTRAASILTACHRSPRVAPGSVPMLPAARVLSLLEFYPHGTHEASHAAPSFARVAGARGGEGGLQTIWGRGTDPTQVLKDVPLSSHANAPGRPAPGYSTVLQKRQVGATGTPPKDAFQDPDESFERERGGEPDPGYDWAPRGNDLPSVLAEGEKRRRLIESLQNTSSPRALPGGPGYQQLMDPGFGEEDDEALRRREGAAAPASSDRMAALRDEFREVMDATGLGDGGAAGAAPAPDFFSRSGSTSPTRGAGPRTSVTSGIPWHPSAPAPSDPIAAPAAESVPRDPVGVQESAVAALHRDLERQRALASALQQEVEGLRSAQATLGSLLDSERRARARAEDRCKELELEVLERQTTWEVERETLNQESVKLSARCRQLQAETALASVFDKYEEEIATLNARLDEATRGGGARPLADTSARANVSPGPGSPGRGAGRGTDQIAALHRTIKGLESERARLEREVREARRRERLHTVYEKQSREQMVRLQELQKAVADREAEVRFSPRALVFVSHIFRQVSACPSICFSKCSFVRLFSYANLMFSIIVAPTHSLAMFAALASGGPESGARGPALGRVLGSRHPPCRPHAHAAAEERLGEQRALAAATSRRFAVGAAARILPPVLRLARQADRSDRPPRSPIVRDGSHQAAPAGSAAKRAGASFLRFFATQMHNVQVLDVLCFVNQD